MKIQHILTGVIAEVVKETKSDYHVKVTDVSEVKDQYKKLFKIGQKQKTGKKLVGVTYKIID